MLRFTEVPPTVSEMAAQVCDTGKASPTEKEVAMLAVQERVCVPPTAYVGVDMAAMFVRKLRPL
jgi:hypothetical protein